MICHRFSGHDTGPHLLITGGVHGDEFEPIVAIRRLISIFSGESEQQKSWVGKVTLVPVVNESAFLKGQRCGEDHLDLARTCPGNPNGSGTERVAHELSQLIRASDYYIDLHTGGTTLSVHPLAGYMLHPDVAVLKQQREMAKAFNLTVIWGTTAAHEGRSLSVARDAGVPAIYCEHGGSGVCTQEGVVSYVDGCLNVMRAIGMMHGEQLPPKAAILVEDSREASGHMQVCHPSPVDGYFETAVKIGQSIQQGNHLGTVTDLSSGCIHQVTAEQTGMVIVLRTFPGVRANDSLGVVLELTHENYQQQSKTA
jgi:predicted deacylase